MTQDERQHDGYATREERDGRGVVRLERRLAATPEEIWPLLVEPEEVAIWLAELTIEPRVGGAYTLSFENTASVSRGHITAFAPPTLLEYRWYEGEAIESLVRFELRPDGGATELVLTHTLLNSASGLHEYAAGWHAHLDLLAARVAGRPADWDWLRFNELLATYSGDTVGGDPQGAARRGDRASEGEDAMMGAAELRLTKPPVAETAMLIRKPVAAVFAAFVDPALTTRFWFTRSSGPLTPGARVRWDWEMYGVGTDVTVNAVEQDRRLVIEWDGYGGRTTVVWRFIAQPDGTTFVTITESGFAGDGDALARQALDAVGGFTLVLAGAKALLEHGIALNLVGDRHPAGLVTG